MKTIAGVLLLAVAGSAWAGRPLTVDDANVADVGGGQLESWYARPASRDKLWTTAVGVGVLDWLELGGAVERNFSGPQTATSLQLKMRLTAARERAAATSARSSAGRTPTAAAARPPTSTACSPATSTAGRCT